MNEQAQDRAVVLAVVVLLGLVSLVGLAGGIILIYEKTDASAVALVFAIPTAAVGALAGILASTRTAPAAPVQAQQAAGYQQAVDDVKALAP